MCGRIEKNTVQVAYPPEVFEIPPCNNSFTSVSNARALQESRGLFEKIDTSFIHNGSHKSRKSSNSYLLVSNDSLLHSRLISYKVGNF